MKAPWSGNGYRAKALWKMLGIKGHAREKHYAQCFFEPYGKDNKVNQRVGTQEGRHAVPHKLLGFLKRYEWGLDQLKMAASKTFCWLCKE